MNLQELMANWSEYEDRKIQSGQDPKYFSYENEWEITYLAEKIHKYNKNIPGENLKVAIDSCTKIFSTPPLRRMFVQCVMMQLR
jgi:hypothetical protein